MRTEFGEETCEAAMILAVRVRKERATRVIDGFHVRAVKVDGDGLHDLFDGDYQPGAILLFHKNAFPAGERPMLDSYSVSNS